MEKKLNNIILVPTDFSEVCQNAIDHGAEVAAFLNYKLCILHVINSETRSFLKKENLGQDSIDKKLEDIAIKIKSVHPVDVDWIAREGSIFSTIHEVVEEIGANLVFLGTHGKIGFQKLIGSYALKVITKSEVPVIVVQKRSFQEGYKNIVFPVSTDSEVRQLVQWAVHISKTFGSVMHLYKIHETDPGIKSQLTVITAQIRAEFEKRGVKYVVNEAVDGKGFAKQVIEYATANRADLIMIMTNPDRLMPHYKLGPWDEPMIFNTSQIPVMCVNPVQFGNVYYDYLTLH